MKEKLTFLWKKKIMIKPEVYFWNTGKTVDLTSLLQYSGSDEII